MQAEVSKNPEKLIGKYFHSADETSKVEWQGLVIGEPHPAWYLVQLFDWGRRKLPGFFLADHRCHESNDE
jgi:hypothetical protein